MLTNQRRQFLNLASRSSQTANGFLPVGHGFSPSRNRRILWVFFALKKWISSPVNIEGKRGPAEGSVPPISGIG
jgi:hypothetical protein